MLAYQQVWIPATGHLAVLFQALWQCLLPSSNLLTDEGFPALPVLRFYLLSLRLELMLVSGLWLCPCVPPFAWRSLVKVVTLISHTQKPLESSTEEGEWRIPDPCPQTHTWAVCPYLPASPQIGGSRLREAPCLQQAWRCARQKRLVGRVLAIARQLLTALPGSHVSS